MIPKKFILREAFNHNNLLPNEVLFRKKEAFSDGVSSINKSWYQILQEYIETIYDNNYLQSEILRLSCFNNKKVIPHSKEALYYRKNWEKIFGSNLNTPNVIPYFWLPNWSGNIKEPSARVLDVYNSTK